MHSKLEGFPSVWFPTIPGNENRKKFMLDQASRYGFDINYQVYPKRQQLAQQYQLVSPDCQSAWFADPAIGVTMSYLCLLKHWYENTTQSEAIFCDDDIDFSTIDHWGFVWQDFYSNLPDDWECIQLIKVNEWVGNGYLISSGEYRVPEIKLTVRHTHDWCTCFIAKRSWIEKLLQKHWINDQTMDLSLWKGAELPGEYWIPCVESVVFQQLDNTTVYNFPLLLEQTDFQSSVAVNHMHQVYHVWSRQYFKWLWRRDGMLINSQKLKHLLQPE